MSSSRNQDKKAILSFPKNYLIWSYLVTLYTCNIQDNFCFHEVPLFSQYSHFSVVMLTDLIKFNYGSQKQAYMRIFSIGLDLVFPNTLKKNFVLGTSISPSFKCIV